MKKSKEISRSSATAAAILILLFVAALAGCKTIGERNTCISCHTDEELLKEVAEPIETQEGSGEG